MMRCRTNAPSAYDYGYTEQVSNKLTDQEVKLFGRVVDIPDESYDYQTDRYLSGSYFVQPVSVTS